MRNNIEESTFNRKVYIGQNRNTEVRLDSTSGGVFSVLSQYVIERDGVVFGAEFDKDFNVIHGKGYTQEDLSRFRGSKYVQSKLGNTFKNVKEILKNGTLVLFTGTPCQIEGLVAYLGNKYENLILMDLVCYSISSPGVWSQYMKHLEKNKKIKMDQVEMIKFRDKTKYGYEYTLMTFYDKEGNELYSSGSESNQMLRSFISNTSTRPSCYKCSFKKVNRVSDFTVWDCYNVYKYKKELDDNKGTSHIMVNSEKGMKILRELNSYLTLCEVDLNEAVKSEPAITERAKPGNIRDDFFKAFANEIDVFDLYFQDTFRVKSERLLRKGLSKMFLYRFIKRKIKR